MRSRTVLAAVFFASLGAFPAFAGPASNATQALSPMHGIHEWVAGYGQGDVDGPFDQARFEGPSGLVYDPVADRLLVADQGSGIRTVALALDNQVGTLGKGDGFNLDGAGFVSPTALAWIEPGALLAVLDPGRASLTVLDLKAGRVAGILSATAGTQCQALLSHGTDVTATNGGLLVSASSSPDLGLFSFTAQGLRFRKAWDVSGLKDGPGLDAVATDSGCVLSLRHLNNTARAYELFVGTSGRPANFFSGTDAQLPLSLTAQELNTAPLAAPWAFVKDGQPFDLVTRSPYLAAQIRPEGVIWKLGVYDRHDRLLGKQDNQLFDKWGNSVYTDKDQPAREWCEGASYAARDSVTHTWYISEPEDGRILSFRPIEGEDRYYRQGTMPGFSEWNFPVARRKEVTRLAVMNLSRMMLPSDTQRHSDAFSKRLEHWLNAMSALDGSPRSYEVCFVGGPYSYEPDGLSSLGQLRGKWAAMQKEVAPDELILVMGPMDLYQTVVDFRSRPVLKDGLPDPVFDPEFTLSPDPSRLDPDYREICGYIKKDKAFVHDFMFDNAGKLVSISGLEMATQTFTQDPYLRSHATTLLKRYLKDLAGKAASGGPHGGRLPVLILYYPDCNGVSMEENGDKIALSDDGPMREILRDSTQTLGWDFLDITGEMRVLAADDPFMIAANLHPLSRGQDDLAFITAWRLLRAQIAGDPVSAR